MPEDCQQTKELLEEEKERAELRRLQQRIETRIAELYREEEKRREELAKAELCNNLSCAEASKGVEIKIRIDLDKPDVNVTWSDLPGHPLFYQYLGKVALIHALKNLDYGDGDPLGNFKFSEEITGIPAWKGALVRLTDKWGRIKSLLKKEKAYVQDETLEDTLLDNAVYSLLVLVLLTIWMENFSETRSGGYK